MVGKSAIQPQRGNMSMVVEEWPLSRLTAYDRNPRKNDAAVDRMAATITEFGFRVPVLAKSDGSLIDGHLRLKAATQLGLATVPVLIADDFTPAQIKAFRLAVNKSAEWATWDMDLLRAELSDLSEAGFDMTLTGFDETELAKLMTDKSAPGDFEAYDESIQTEHTCPSCGYQWSGGKVTFKGAAEGA